jgi:hypothetical protein
VPSRDEPITPGSTWRARSSFAAIQEIRIVSETESRFEWLIEWVSEGRQLRMSGDGIRSGFTLVVAAEPSVSNPDE